MNPLTVASKLSFLLNLSFNPRPFRMYQMGPKSPSVNGSGPPGKPPAVSDAQAREKLAVRRFNLPARFHEQFSGLCLRVFNSRWRQVSCSDFSIGDSVGKVNINRRSARFPPLMVSFVSPSVDMSYTFKSISFLYRSD